MDQEDARAQGFGATLKVAGIIVAVLGMFTPENRLINVAIGFGIILLGFLVVLLGPVSRQYNLLGSGSLFSRWRDGLVLLFCSLCLLGVAYQPIEMLFSWISRHRDISPTAVLGLRTLTLIILGPFVFAALLEREVLARLRAFWVRGLKFGLIAGLVILPWILIQQAFALIVRFGVVGADSRVKAGLGLVAFLVSILFVPLWALPLFRRLSEGPLGRGIRD